MDYIDDTYSELEIVYYYSQLIICDLQNKLLDGDFHRGSSSKHYGSIHRNPFPPLHKISAMRAPTSTNTDKN